MLLRGRSRYPPLRKGTQRDSGDFEWVSCGAHQSRSVKRKTNALDCTKKRAISRYGVRLRLMNATILSEREDETAPLSERGGMRGLVRWASLSRLPAPLPKEWAGG